MDFFRQRKTLAAGGSQLLLPPTPLHTKKKAPIRINHLHIQTEHQNNAGFTADLICLGSFNRNFRLHAVGLTAQLPHPILIWPDERIQVNIVEVKTASKFNVVFDYES